MKNNGEDRLIPYSFLCKKNIRTFFFKSRFFPVRFRECCCVVTSVANHQDRVDSHCEVGVVTEMLPPIDRFHAFFHCALVIAAFLKF